MPPSAYNPDNPMGRLSEEYLKSVSESQLKDRAYTPYEMEKHERDSLKEIKRCVKAGKYTDKKNIQDSLEFIENLANKMSHAIAVEKQNNKTTWELETELADIKKVFEMLEMLLQNMESKESDASVKRRKK